MQLIAEAYDLMRQRLGASARAHEDLRGVERGRPRVVPHRDHREGAGSYGCRHRQAVRRHRARSGRAEGHRTLDGAERARSRRPDHRHRRGDVRPRPVGRGRNARPPRRCCPANTAPPAVSERDAYIDDVRQALYASKVVAYSQGFDQIAARQRRVRLGHRQRRDGPHLARRMHHPRALPEPDHRGVRARSEPAAAAR